MAHKIIMYLEDFNRSFQKTHASHFSLTCFLSANSSLDVDANAEKKLCKSVNLFLFKRYRLIFF